MATEVASKYTKAQRRKAAKILQKAHDYIEVNGFDIQSYGTEKPAAILARCYIGTVRTVAGVVSEPTSPYHGYDETADATEGDGPELVLALEVLDTVAKPRLERLVKWDEDGDTKRPTDFEVETGRCIEAVGLLFQEKLRATVSDPDKRNAQMKADALKMLRKALTELYESGDLK